MAKSVFGAIEFVLNIIKMKGTEIIIISNIESDLSLIKFPNVEIVDLNNFDFIIVFKTQENQRFSD